MIQERDEKWFRVGVWEGWSRGIKITTGGVRDEKGDLTWGKSRIFTMSILTAVIAKGGR